jgi:hypothetical protein
VAAPATSIAVPPVAAAAPSSSSVPVVVATKTAKSPAAGTLKVMLGADNKLVVTRNGKAVTKLGRGTYSFVVSDKSGKQDVSVRRIGGSNSLLTGKGFTGTKTVRIDLSPGQWKLFSAANEQGIFAFFTVTKS